MRTIHRSCHRCPFPKPPPLLQATAVTPPGRKPIFHMPGGSAQSTAAVRNACANRPLLPRFYMPRPCVRPREARRQR